MVKLTGFALRFPGHEIGMVGAGVGCGEGRPVVLLQWRVSQAYSGARRPAAGVLHHQSPQLQDNGVR